MLSESEGAVSSDDGQSRRGAFSDGRADFVPMPPLPPLIAPAVLAAVLCWLARRRANNPLALIPGPVKDHWLTGSTPATFLRRANHL